MNLRKIIIHAKENQKIRLTAILKKKTTHKYFDNIKRHGYLRKTIQKGRIEQS